MSELRARGNGEAIEITPLQAQALVGLTRSQGWQVLLDIMQNECVKQDTKLINVDPQEPSKVLAEHALAKAMWMFFVRVQKNVNYAVNEITGASSSPSAEAGDGEDKSQPDEIKQGE